MVCLLSQRSIRGCLPLEEGQGLGLHGRPFPLSSSPRPLKVKAAPQPPAPKKDGQRDGGREGVDTKHSAGSHTNTHTLRGGLYPSAAPCSATPRDPPSPGPRPHYAAGPEAWGVGGGVVTPRGAAEGWRGSAPQPGVLPGPAHSGSELRWASEGASSPFVPYPSAPLPDTLAASRRCRSLRSPYPVWRSGAGGGDASFPFRPHGERWEAREELRPCACEGKWGCRGATTGSQPVPGSLKTGRRAERDP